MKIYNSLVQAVTGPAAVLAACDQHPLARFAVGLLAAPTGFTHGGSTLFFGEARGDGDTGFLVGRPDQFDDLLNEARAAGLLDRLGWMHLPKGCPVPDGFVVRDTWDLLWTVQATAGPADASVLALPAEAHVEVNALLDLAMPHSTVRPGDRSAPQWYGIRAGDVLVACGADRSGHLPSPAPVGVVGGIAVHPEHRGRGYGKAVTAAVTNRLLEQYDLVTLGVYPDNLPANRIYEQLGYTARSQITSINPTPTSP